ncbi:MAG TPA: HAMP domain-containing protein, partial [Nitrospiria bacterium]|nr:HAMP domain-containing protein [Nitrospiria bacterium]
MNEAPNFFNGTEDWWREACDGGRGKDYIGNLYFNEQTQSYLINIATPVVDREGIEAIGVLAVFHDARRLLDPIVSVIRFGKTGHAMLVDSDGRVIVCPVMPTGTILQGKKLVQNITSFSPEWVLAEDDGHGGGDSIIGFSPLVTTTNITLDSTGNSWHSFIRQDPTELYAPLNSLLISVFFSGVLLLGVVAFLGVFLSSRLTRPIQILEEGAEEISKGNLNVSVNIETKDEIEKLAHAFNNMSQKLRESYSNLEQKVEDRTKELSALNLIAMTINQSLELKHILESTVKKVIEALELESGAVWLWDAKRENLEIQVSQGFPNDFIEETRRLSLKEIEERYFLKPGPPFIVEGG